MTGMNGTVFKKINVWPQTKVKLETLAKSDNSSMAQYIEEVANFFKKTGISPRADYESSAKAFETIDRRVKTTSDRIIAFIQKQEKDFLLPVYDNISQLLELAAEGKVKQKISGAAADKSVKIPDVDTKDAAVVTQKDEEIFKLKKQNVELYDHIKELVSGLTENIDAFNNYTYSANITKSQFDEFRAKYLID
ncbi:MAG: hypothetical protein LBG96_16285 [Tannerella sp.]|jgi:molecular chaperone GrpE (heat shock protein)|nr:hypothetical protein [Tannerella sp.]